LTDSRWLLDIRPNAVYRRRRSKYRQVKLIDSVRLIEYDRAVTRNLRLKKSNSMQKNVATPYSSVKLEARHWLRDTSLWTHRRSLQKTCFLSHRSWKTGEVHWLLFM